MNQPLPEANHPSLEDGDSLPDQEIFEVFQKVLEKWAFLPSEYIGKVEEGPADLSLERMVAFTGPQQGLMVVRAQEEFGEFLWENLFGVEGTPNEPSREDAFTEFVNLFFGHLSQRLRHSSSGTFEPFLPQVSHPGLWPSRRPTVGFAVLVDGIPLEIRLWIENPAAQASPL